MIIGFAWIRLTSNKSSDSEADEEETPDSKSQKGTKTKKSDSLASTRSQRSKRSPFMGWMLLIVGTIITAYSIYNMLFPVPVAQDTVTPSAPLTVGVFIAIMVLVVMLLTLFFQLGARFAPHKVDVKLSPKGRLTPAAVYTKAKQAASRASLHTSDRYEVNPIQRGWQVTLYDLSGLVKYVASFDANGAIIGDFQEQKCEIQTSTVAMIVMAKHIPRGIETTTHEYTIKRIRSEWVFSARKKGTTVRNAGKEGTCQIKVNAYTHECTGKSF